MSQRVYCYRCSATSNVTLNAGETEATCPRCSSAFVEILPPVQAQPRVRARPAAAGVPGIFGGPFDIFRDILLGGMGASLGGGGAGLGLDILGGIPIGLGGGGGGGGVMGDYVFGEQAFNDLISRLFTAHVEPPRPADQSVISSLPRVRSRIFHKQCPVCLEDFEPGSEAVQLPCNHLYHEECLKPWMEEHNTCAVCRHELPVDQARQREMMNNMMNGGSAAGPTPSGRAAPTAPATARTAAPLPRAAVGGADRNRPTRQDEVELDALAGELLAGLLGGEAPHLPSLHPFLDSMARGEYDSESEEGTDYSDEEEDEEDSEYSEEYTGSDSNAEYPICPDCGMRHPRESDEEDEDDEDYSDSDSSLPALISSEYEADSVSDSEVSIATASSMPLLVTDSDSDDSESILTESDMPYLLTDSDSEPYYGSDCDIPPLVDSDSESEGEGEGAAVDVYSGEDATERSRPRKRIRAHDDPTKFIERGDASSPEPSSSPYSSMEGSPEPAGPSAPSALPFPSAPALPQGIDYSAPTHAASSSSSHHKPRTIRPVPSTSQAPIPSSSSSSSIPAPITAPLGPVVPSSSLALSLSKRPEAPLITDFTVRSLPPEAGALFSTPLSIHTTSTDAKQHTKTSAPMFDLQPKTFLPAQALRSKFVSARQSLDSIPSVVNSSPEDGPGSSAVLMQSLKEVAESNRNEDAAPTENSKLAPADRPRSGGVVGFIRSLLRI